MFSFGDVDGVSFGVDLDVFFESDSAEEVNFKGDVVFDEFFGAVPDGDNIAFLDELSGVSFEEGFGGGGLVGHDAIDHGYFLAFLGFDEPWFGAHYLDVDIVAASMSLQIFDFDEFGLCQCFVLCHKLNIKNKTKNILLKTL